MSKRKTRTPVAYDLASDIPTYFVQYKQLSNDIENMPLDVTFTLDGGETIKANRMLLGVRSPVFHAMLDGHLREASEHTVKISDIDYETFNGVLEWVTSCDYVESFSRAHQKAVQMAESQGEKGDNGTGFYSSSFFKRRKYVKPPKEICKMNNGSWWIVATSR